MPPIRLLARQELRSPADARRRGGAQEPAPVETPQPATLISGHPIELTHGVLLSDTSPETINPHLFGDGILSGSSKVRT
jgi:hypothetical protein